MARKPKSPVVTTPKRVVRQTEEKPSREERQAARRLRSRFAPRLGWGGRFGGRAPVEDAGTGCAFGRISAKGVTPQVDLR